MDLIITILALIFALAATVIIGVMVGAAVANACWFIRSLICEIKFLWMGRQRREALRVYLRPEYSPFWSRDFARYTMLIIGGIGFSFLCWWWIELAAILMVTTMTVATFIGIGCSIYAAGALSQSQQSCDTNKVWVKSFKTEK